MAFSKKIWKDRVSEYPTRRILTKTDNTTETVVVTRSEGEISQEGDIFSASNMNDLESRIFNEFENVDEVKTEKLESGTYQGSDGKTYTCTLFDKIGYDATNKKLLLKIGDNNVIPFSGGGVDNVESLYTANIINGHNTSISGSKSFGSKEHNAVIVAINVELEDKRITSQSITFNNSTVALSIRVGNGFVFVLGCDYNKTITMTYSINFSSSDSESIDMVVIGM